MSEHTRRMSRVAAELRRDHENSECGMRNAELSLPFYAACSASRGDCIRPVTP